jgi:hypothetical protein
VVQRLLLVRVRRGASRRQHGAARRLPGLPRASPAVPQFRAGGGATALFSDPPPPISDSAYALALRVYQPGLAKPRAAAPFARFLGGYQDQIYLRGTLLGLILLAGLGGLAARWRRWGGLGLLPWAVALVLLALPVAVADFDYRYELAVAPFACLAAGLALTRGRPAEAIRAGQTSQVAA